MNSEKGTTENENITSFSMYIMNNHYNLHVNQISAEQFDFKLNVDLIG